MASFQRHVEVDVLQAHTANLNQALSDNPGLFASQLVQCGFTVPPTVSNIVDTMGFSNYQKASKLLSIVDARIRTASSREVARSFFDNLVVIVAYHLGHLHIAEALVATYSE